MVSVKKNPIATVCTLSLLLLWVYVFFINFWVSDDAYITLRTIENFASGYGLRFNVEERVQAYTHPLWLWLLIPWYLLTSSAVWSVLIVSFCASLLALYILFKRYQGSKERLLVFLLLCNSQAYVHYASSGLENIAGCVFLGAIYLYVLQPKREEPRYLYLFSLLCSLSCLLRPDYLLFVALPWILCCYTDFIAASKKRMRCTIIFLLPLLLWHSFTLIYYGFPLPNTYYAKMQTGVPLLHKLEKGMQYFYASMTEDLVTMIILSCAFVVVLKHGRRHVRLLMLSIALYLFYVASIGGDFMLGRFFSIPFYLSLLLLQPGIRMLVQETLIYRASICILSILLVFHPFAVVSRPYPLLEVQKARNSACPFYSEAFVADEQCFYWGETNPFFKGQGFVDWFEPLVEYEAYGERCIPEVVIGLYGYTLGSSSSIIDLMGLADPLMARVPIDPHVNEYIDFRTGHISRRLPHGYLALCEGEVEQLSDPHLNVYYEGLKQIVSGPLWEKSRWNLIWEYNVGKSRRYTSLYRGESYLDDELIDSEEAELLVQEKLELRVMDEKRNRHRGR